MLSKKTKNLLLSGLTGTCRE